MVKIAVAGGSGQVAREIIDGLVETKKHEIIILSRKEPSTANPVPGVSWVAVDYDDKQNLVQALHGVHTLLSFVQTLTDADQASQRNIIDAAIAAGVKRFAPSEFGSKGIVDMPWAHAKQKIREYLEQVNSPQEVLEYTLFQPGLFLDYLAAPHRTTKYIDPLQIFFDFENRSAVIIDGHQDTVMTLTAVADLVAVVVRAVEYEGKWPRIGGIRGNRLAFSEIFEIGRRVRGKAIHRCAPSRPFDISKEKLQDLEAGILRTENAIKSTHYSIQENGDEMRKTVTIGFLLSAMKGAWDSSDEWNQLLPDYNFTQAEEFLAKIWDGKP